jgi:hypothetical protein
MLVSNLARTGGKAMESIEGKAFVMLKGQTIVIQYLEIQDEELVTYLSEFPAEKRADIVRRAVKIGLLSLKGNTAIERVDYIEKEFDKLSQRLLVNLDDFSKKSKESLDRVFSEDGGILKTALEKYLGEGGKLEDLFDPQRKDSAISRISSIFEEHFRGRDSVLYKLLDHSNVESPIASLKKELVEGYLKDMRERLIAKEAIKEEREKGTAKGREYQKEVFDKLNELCKPYLDIPEYTADTIGRVAKSKVGDVVVTVDPSSTSGVSLRMVIEAKDSGSYSVQKIRDELEEAKKNRDASVAIAVFTSTTCPSGCEPFQQYGDDKIICTFDPEGSDCLALCLAYRLSRILALSKVRVTAPQINKEQVKILISQCFEKVKAVSSIKSKVTSLSTALNNDLDTLKREIEEPLLALERVLA